MAGLKFTASVLLLVAPTLNASAASLDDYLIIGQYVNDTAVDVSSYELGRVSALAGSARAVSGPGVGPTVSNTPTYDGNVAVTSTTGSIKLSGVKVYADTGIDCAGTYANCTLNGANFSNSKYDEAGGAAQRSIGLSPNGVNVNQNLTPVLDALALASQFINDLGPGHITGSIVTTSGDINSNLVVNLLSGLNILDFSGTGGSDITVKANLIFQGPSDAYAIVLIPDGTLFKTSQGNLVIGNGGIGLNNVVIVGTDDSNDAQFDLSTTIINGVSLWDLGGGLSNMKLANVTGCTQLVGQDVDIQNVRLSQCGFNVSVIPVPPAVWLFGSALGVMGWMRRKLPT